MPETHHAQQRQAQRGLRPADIAFVLEHGSLLAGWGGADIVYLRRREVPPPYRKQYARLIGTAIVLCEGRIVTVYRNRSRLPLAR